MSAKITFLVVLFSSVAVLSGLFYSSYVQEQFVQITGGSIGQEYYGMVEDKENKIVTFDLVDPESAPENIRDQVLLGYNIFTDIKTYAPEYSGNELTCNNCHFCGGNSLGGKNRGISLVGVTEMYPRFSKRDKKNITLLDRLTNCFKRSLNGKAPPVDGEHMKALVAYLSWISKEVGDMPQLPWLGLVNVTSKHVPNVANGLLVYEANCAICHGNDGEGNKEEVQNIPPLWGDLSFNDGAGMNTMPMLSVFIWQNMPYGQPTLSLEEALDVAAFIISKPRPHFVNQ